MTRPKKYARPDRPTVFVLLAALLVPVIAGTWLTYIERSGAEPFYRQALSDAGIDAPTLVQKQELSVAYAAGLARRSPIFGLSGTNLSELGRGIEQLEDARTQTALAQPNEKQREDIARYLYPTDFITKLARAEDSRRSFILAPSEKGMLEYFDALGSALLAYETDLRLFTDAFRRNVSDPPDLVLLQGVITKESVLSSLEAAEERIRELRLEHAKRKACILGVIRACNPSDLRETYALETRSADKLRASVSLAKEVASIISDAHPSGNDFLSKRVLVALYGSTCADGLPNPHYFLQSSPVRGSAVESLIFVGDLFSYPPSDQAREAGFAFLSPTTYYLCPLIGRDIGRASATRHAYGRMYPGRDISYTGGLVLDENRARDYVLEELQNPMEATNDEDLAREFTDNGAGFDALIQDIAAQQSAVVRQAQNQRDTDLGAEWTFFVRSGFASLFLFHHRSMEPMIGIFSEPQSREGLSQVIRWSTLRTSMDRDSVIGNIRVFLEAHRADDLR